MASDLAAIEGADLILRHGIGLDDWLDGTLSASTKAHVVTVTDGVPLRKGEEDGKEIDDPHVWHDPANDKIMVDNIAKALDAADPPHKPQYDGAAAAYDAKLDTTRTQVQALIDEIPPQNRKLVTDHDALSYFANAFGLEVIGAVIPGVSTDSGDSGAELWPVIRNSPMESGRGAEPSPIICNSPMDIVGAAELWPVIRNTPIESGSGAETVDGMLLYNARKISDALK